MAAPAQPVTRIQDWPGLSQSRRANVAGEPGSANEQENACSIIPGELLVRRGIRQIQFEDD